MPTDLIALDALTVRSTVRLVSGLSDADMSLPTPCAGWDLGALLAHMTAQHRGFAAAASGHGGDLAAWSPKPSSVRDYAASADLVLSAFASPGVLDRMFELPEFGASFPGRLAVGFHLVDYVVHGWDVARAVGQDLVLDEESCRTVLRMGRNWPDIPRIWGGPGAPWANRVPVADDAPVADRMLGFLGRTPNWPGQDM